MPKANLDRCWSYAEQGHAKAYGPGEIEIPDGLYKILSEKGYLDSTDERTLEDVAGKALAEKLKEAGYKSPDDLEKASDEDLLAIDGLGKAKLKQIREDLK